MQARADLIKVLAMLHVCSVLNSPHFVPQHMTQVWLPFEAIVCSQLEENPGAFSHRKLLTSVISSHRGGRGPADFFGASVIRAASDLDSFMVLGALRLRAEFTQLDGASV